MGAADVVAEAEVEVEVEEVVEETVPVGEEVVVDACTLTKEAVEVDEAEEEEEIRRRCIGGTAVETAG